jgi:hypothetical protein
VTAQDEQALCDHPRPRLRLANHTGSWRTERPVYVDRCPRATTSAPPAKNIQGNGCSTPKGNYEAAWRHLTKDNPFPAIMGRVCYHTCEGACNRAQLDAAVGINSVERFLGDEAIKRAGSSPPAAELLRQARAVVGAGPSGLSAAYHLRRLGHEVTVRDAGPDAGGMMRFGIPKYRLPREHPRRRDASGSSTWASGRAQHQGRQHLEDAGRQGFDAAFLAVGAHIGKRAYIPAGSSPRSSTRSVLRSMEGEEKPMLGRRVVVYGGGNTAIDVARTAKRWAPRGDHRLPPQPRQDAGARLRGRRGDAGRRDDQVAVDDQAGRRRRSPSRREDGARRDRLSATDRRIRDAGSRLVVLALGQDVDLACSRACRA